MAEFYETGTHQKLWVHNKEYCSGRCAIHNPSDHSLKDAPTHWRSDRALMERICEHGIGHYDVDQFEYHKSIGREYESIHGCDDCCSWPQIEGKEARWVAEGYAVTEDGRVWSYWRLQGPKRENKHLVKKDIPPHQLSAKDNGKGYMQVQLGRGVDRYVHRLIYEAFGGDIPDEQQVRHINGIRNDNRFENLTIGTPSQNELDKWGHGTMRHGPTHHNSKLNEEIVKESRELYNSGLSLNEIISKLNLSVSKSALHEAVRRNTWKWVN